MKIFKYAVLVSLLMACGCTQFTEKERSEIWRGGYEAGSVECQADLQSKLDAAYKNGQLDASKGMAACEECNKKFDEGYSAGYNAARIEANATGREMPPIVDYYEK